MLRLPSADTDKDGLIEVLSALFDLSHAPQFQTVRKWIESEYGRISRENIVADGQPLHWNQGALQLIESLMEKVDKSSEMIDILRDKSK